LGIRLRWLADFPGHYGAACGEQTLDAVLAAGVDSVIGFNVGGIEVDRDQFAAVFDRARAAGLHSVPHAGETHGPDRIWSAIHRLGAERIGHGIRCLDDPALVEYLRDTQLPLDVWLTSNWRTGAVSRDRPHPLPALLDAGLMVTLNSDDPAMFGTDLANEYRVAYGLGLTPAELADLARNGVRASFMTPEDKTAVLAEIDGVGQFFEDRNSGATPRRTGSRDDDEGVREQPRVPPDPALGFLDVYDTALPPGARLPIGPLPGPHPGPGSHRGDLPRGGRRRPQPAHAADHHPAG
jgi:hypothetical protein